MSTLRRACIIFEESVCRVFTKGPRALITANAKIGSLLLEQYGRLERHWFFKDDGEESVEETLTFCLESREVNNWVI